MTLTKEDLRERIRWALASQKRPTVTVLSSLLATQDRLGYLPDEAIEEVAGRTGTSINEVWGVATFYTNFRFHTSRRAPGRGVLGPNVSPARRPGHPEAGPGRSWARRRGRHSRRQGHFEVQHMPGRLLAGAGNEHRPSTPGTPGDGPGKQAARRPRRRTFVSPVSAV